MPVEHAQTYSAGTWKTLQEETGNRLLTTGYWPQHKMHAMTHRAVRLLLVLPLAASLHASQPEPADTVLLNGTVITVDPGDSIAEALAIKDGKIVFVGSSAAARTRAGEKTEVIDLAGRTATPGLIDTHVHFSEPADNLDLGDARSMDEVITRVRAFAATRARGTVGARRRLGRGKARRAALHHRRGPRQSVGRSSRLPDTHHRPLRRRQLAGAEALEHHEGHARSAGRHDRSRQGRQSHRRPEGARDVADCARQRRRRRTRRRHDARRRAADHRRLQPRRHDRREGPERQPGEVQPLQEPARGGETERPRHGAVARRRDDRIDAPGRGLDQGGTQAARDARQRTTRLGRREALHRRQRRRPHGVDVRRLEQRPDRHRHRQQGVSRQRRGLPRHLQTASDDADRGRPSTSARTPSAIAASTSSWTRMPTR